MLATNQGGRPARSTRRPVHSLVRNFLYTEGGTRAVAAPCSACFQTLIRAPAASPAARSTHLSVRNRSSAAVGAIAGGIWSWFGRGSSAASPWCNKPATCTLKANGIRFIQLHHLHHRLRDVRKSEAISQCLWCSCLHWFSCLRPQQWQSNQVLASAHCLVDAKGPPMFCQESHCPKPHHRHSHQAEHQPELYLAQGIVQDVEGPQHHLLPQLHLV